VDVPPVEFTDLDLPASGERSEAVAARIADARKTQDDRFSDTPGMALNADATGEVLDEIARPDAEGHAMLSKVAERFQLSARGYHRVLRVARTIADLDGSDQVRRPHIAEAVSFRLSAPTAA
jgi:magnesium chelatase family protein